MSGAPEGRPARFVAWTLRHRTSLLGAALLVTVPAASGMARLYRGLATDMEALLPRDAPAVAALATLRERFAGVQHLGVVVQGSSPGAPADFASRLALRVAAYPPELVRSVHADVARERRFLRENAALYLPLDDLRDIRARLDERRARANPLFVPLDDDASASAQSLDLGDIDARIRARDPFAGRFPDDRLVSQDGRVAVVLIFPAPVDTGLSRVGPLLERVRADVAALKTAGLRVGYAGDVAIGAEELEALEADLAASSVAVVVLCAVAVLLFTRWWGALPVLAFPLACGTAWAFGLGGLGIDALNTNTAFLGAIVVGNGVNPGIMLLARHLEERRRGVPFAEAIERAVAGTWRGTLAAALAAAAAYGSLIATRFRGFNQFGVIGALGMLLCWAAAYLLLPPLLHLFDRHGRARIETARPSLHASLAARLVTARPRLVLAAAAVAFALGAVAVTRLDAGRVEYDMTKLRRRDSAISGEAYWGSLMNQVLGRNFTGVAMLAESPLQIPALEARLRDAIARPPLRRVVSRLVTPGDLVPADQQAKLSELRAIRRSSDGTLGGFQTSPGSGGRSPPAPGSGGSDAAASARDDRATVDVGTLLGVVDRGPFVAADVPELLAQGLRERDGTFGRTLLLLQSLDGATWDGRVAIDSERALRAVAASATPPALFSGGFVISAAILETLEREALRITALAFAAVAALVSFTFGGLRERVLVLGALLGGVLLLVGAVVALDLRINFVSFVAFPITFGIGVEYAVNVVQRHRLQPGDLAATVHGTGRAVVLCSLTTIIGYGSLLLARNRALFSFGQLAVLGEIACLLVAVLVLPAALCTLRRRSA